MLGCRWTLARCVVRGRGIGLAGAAFFYFLFLLFFLICFITFAIKLQMSSNLFLNFYKNEEVTLGLILAIVYLGYNSVFVNSLLIPHRNFSK